ncbi:MAG TPA: 5'-3' exonuclease H3TH domain-containing protein, partial [Polyangiales bacterium]|nr:5'-3' exonuclease H3TH domain-containing protein [Polyangiales bacterium]
GDPSDNLPGVPGVGARTASRLAQQHADMHDLLDHLDTVQPERLREALRAASSQLLQNERLARLDARVPLPEGPRFGLPDRAALEKVRALFEELEFKSLIGRLPA